MESRNSYPPPEYRPDDDLTLKEIIINLHNFWIEYWRSRRNILKIASIITGIVFLYSGWTILKNTLLTEKTYSSGLQFSLVEENIDNMGQLKQNFGDSSMILSSRRIHDLFLNSLLRKIEFKGETDFMGNHLIKLYDLHKKWELESSEEIFEPFALKDFYFTHNDIDNLSSKEERAFFILKDFAFGKGLRDMHSKSSNPPIKIELKYFKESESFTLYTTSIDAQFSNLLVAEIYDQLIDTYLREKTTRVEKSLRILREVADSVLLELTAAENIFKSASENLQKDKSGVLQDLLRNQTPLILEDLLSEDALLNVEISSNRVSAFTKIYEDILNRIRILGFQLRNQTTRFEILNRIFIPQENKPRVFNEFIKSAIFKNMAISFIGTLLLAAVYIFCRRVITNALADS